MICFPTNLLGPLRMKLGTELQDEHAHGAIRPTISLPTDLFHSLTMEPTQPPRPLAFERDLPWADRAAQLDAVWRTRCEPL